MNIAVGDLGASAAKKYDIEAWLPGQGRYRELTSSLEHDRLPGPPARHPLPARGRQARATCTRSTAPPSAVGRTLIALLENAQREDGSVSIPEPLVQRGAPARIGPYV